MNQENQYQSPQSNVETTSPDEYSKIRIFGVSGRIGRIRYLAYSFGFMALIFILNAIISVILPLTAAPQIAGVITGLLLLLTSIVTVLFGFLFAIQRSHDFNTTGWLSLITLVPFGMFVLLLIPGTVGENRFGKQPPPNSAGVTIVSILATLFVVIGIIGIIAAIAIPAYNAYIQQAQMM